MVAMKKTVTSGLPFKCIWIYGVGNAVVLGLVLAAALSGGEPSVFMWVRAAILVGATPFLLWLENRARSGSESAGGRLRLVSTILPVAVIVVDFIPGVAPVWYGLLQGLCALVLVPVAVSTMDAMRKS
ncbi:hypothetical protein [Leifsonia sp. NPDC058230]|uniref:hypothetical protein n=1 Tax=Leifsonia sp. NPDC058230 TaxID=3346391 RepID=UPI0036D91458